MLSRYRSGHSRKKKKPRPLTEADVADLQERGRKAAADGLLGFELDRQLKAERLSPAEHRIVRAAFNVAVVANVLKSGLRQRSQRHDRRERRRRTSRTG